VHLPGYTLVSAIASYELKPGTTVYVRAENLLDTSYEDVFSYRAPGFAAYAGLRVKLGGE
jgi:vitamin B12 transporter